MTDKKKTAAEPETPDEEVKAEEPTEEPITEQKAATPSRPEPRLARRRYFREARERTG